MGKLQVLAYFSIIHVMPGLTSNSVSMSLRKLYLSCVRILVLHCPLRLNISLHLEGDTVPTRWRFYRTISRYGNELRGTSVTCILTLYYYMSPCYITFLNRSMNLLHILCGCFLGDPYHVCQHLGATAILHWNYGYFVKYLVNCVFLAYC